MKKILVAFMFGLMAIAAQAEATFDQVQGLIEQHQYQAAASGLEGIIQNHPKSAKAFYAMAQAQAGLGNLEKAQKALNIATGLNPTLDFAPASSVASLKQAITPQVAKIEVIEESHFWRDFAYGALIALFVWACYFLWRTHNSQKDQDEGSGYAGPTGGNDPKPTPPTTPLTTRTTTSTPAPGSMYRTPYVPTPAPAPSYTPQASSPTPTVVNNHYGSSNDGLLTGMVIGNMMGNSHHHDTVIVERPAPVYVEREATIRPSRSSWDDDNTPTPSTPSRSSSWDDTPSRSSSRSSSWDDDSSSSKSSSSWSSSSSSDSSSSWSDSSSSSSDSSSSWD